MSADEKKLGGLIRGLRSCQGALIGDVMLDHDVKGNPDRLSPEAPIQVLEVTDKFQMPGGAANVALAVSEAMRRALRSEFGIDQERVSLIHEFVPEAHLGAINGSRPRWADDDTLVVGTAGMPAWRKGTTICSQTAAEVRRLVGPSARVA
jgi:hypothetical protein